MAIMAGMLAGAESARRRQQQQRLRQAGSAANSIAGNEAKHNSSVATKRIVRSNNNNNNNNNNNYMSRELHDWSLGSGAREAKERLDEKLRNHRASVMRRRYNVASTVGALQKEIFSYRKSTRRFNWSSKLAWNNNKTAAEAKPYRTATECAVCLEEFRAGDELTHLPCAHRFHRSCAAPWLEISPCCPFCRACIFSFQLEILCALGLA